MGLSQRCLGNALNLLEVNHNQQLNSSSYRVAFSSKSKKDQNIFHVQVLFQARGPPRHALEYKISKSTGFHMDFGFQNGFLNFTVDFWISK